MSTSGAAAGGHGVEADLVLEGGGVKGIALVGAVEVLEERGYRFPRIAGTSAGAVVGALLAAGYTAAQLRALMPELALTDFRDPGMLDRFGAVGKSLSILFEQGVYEGKALHAWLTERLAARGVRTFGDLRYAATADDSLPAHLAYRLVVTASDISRGRLVRFPWDYAAYGLDPDRQPVADAVRASISIPFFYEPVRLAAPALREPVWLVDGGLVSNFPIDVFDRREGAPRWPTLGIKLSARPDALQVANPVGGVVDFSRALIATMVSARDQMHLDDPCVVRRTIFVDTGKVKATDFDLDEPGRLMLYDNGRRAASRFLATWSFEEYLRECRGGAVVSEGATGAPRPPAPS